MFLYFLGEILILEKINLWSENQTKNSIFWFFSFFFIIIFKFNKLIENPRSFLKALLIDCLKLITILQFIINFNSFNLATELLLTILTAFLTASYYFAKKDGKLKPISNIIDFTFVSLVLIFLYNFISVTLSDPSSFFNKKSFFDFLTPILLTILFLPFLSFLAIYNSYQKVFSYIEVNIDQKKIIFLTKLYCLTHFNFSIYKKEIWFEYIKHKKIKNHSDLLESIYHTKKQISRQRNPPAVDLKLGWSPYLAQYFLKTCNLNTYEYSYIYDEIWFCTGSLYLEKASITYCITGNENYALQLSLELFLYDIKHEEKHFLTFMEILKTLIRNCLNTPLPKEIEEKIINKESTSKQVNEKQILFTYEVLIEDKCQYLVYIKNNIQE